MKVAFVTGSNKGIGKAIVSKLAGTLQTTGRWDIYLTARNVERGRQACADLAKQGLDVKFHQLDITDKNSRQRFLEFINSHYPNGINVAVNNAGIAYIDDSTVPFSEQARLTMQTNFFDTLKFTEEFIPFLAPDARVVHLSSLLGHNALRKLSPLLYDKFTSPLTMVELQSLAIDFVRHAQIGEHERQGWPSTAYGVSKLCLTKASYILGEQLRNDPRNIVMNSCCPGYVDTDMTHHKGSKTPEQGADTPFYLATLPLRITEPINEFVSERRIRAWGRPGKVARVKGPQ